MRLLRLDSNGHLTLTSFVGDIVPKYAILSHTWLPLDGEVTFEDIRHQRAEITTAGYQKILFCAQQAAQDGLDYFWVDAYCIDKSSSAELQEALTAMFSWYRNAAECYVYLSDVFSPRKYDRCHSQAILAQQVSHLSLVHMRMDPTRTHCSDKC
jgi:hypothetical protein